MQLVEFTDELKSKVVSQYKQNRQGKLIKETVEVYKRNTPLPLANKTSPHFFILPYNILTEFPTLILFHEFHCILLDSDIQQSPRSIKIFLELKKSCYTTFYDRFSLLDFGTSEKEKYGVIQHRYDMEYSHCDFSILSKDVLLGNVFIKNSQHLVSLLADLFQNPFSPVEFSSDGFDVATLMVSKHDRTQGELVFEDFRVKVNCIDCMTPKLSHMDRVNVDLSNFEEIQPNVEYDASLIIKGLNFYKPKLMVGSCVVVDDIVKIFPIDVRFPSTHFLSETLRNYHQKKVCYFQMNNRAQIYEVLGDSGDILVEILSIFRKWDIRPSDADEPFEFSPEKNLEWIREKMERTDHDNSISLSEDQELSESSRRDFTKELVFSIDPSGCTDIDDAFHVKYIKNDTGRLSEIEVGVHIADVSHYVRPGTAMDREAFCRGTSVYFSQFRIDMLPSMYSANLCSLRQGMRRKTLSCIYRFDGEIFNLIDSEFVKGEIVNSHALKYSQANQMMQQLNSYILPENLLGLPEALLVLSLLAKKQSELRSMISPGSDGNVPLLLNSEDFDTQVLDTSKQSEVVLDTHSTVEDFMLLTNIKAASLCFDFYPEFSCLRKHEKPSPFQIKNSSLCTAAEINSFISHARNSRLFPSSSIIAMVVASKLAKAKYVCSGDEVDFSHFGLAAPIYTHFTSPIRRYPDIIVHRMVSAIISASDPFVCSSEMCAALNYRESFAQHASRMENEIHKAQQIFRSGSRFSGFVLNSSEIVIMDLDVFCYCPSLANYPEDHFLYKNVTIAIVNDWSDYCIHRHIIAEIIL